MHQTVAAIVWILTGYLLLQFLLNVVRRIREVKGRGRIKRSLLFSVANHVYLLAAGGWAAVELGIIQFQQPDWLWIGIAVVLAPLVFGLSVLLRQTGGKLFGRSGFVNPQDAVFYLTEERRWWTAGVINTVVLKALAEETFLRGLVFVGALGLEPFGANSTMNFLFAALTSAAVQNLFYPVKAWALDTTMRAFSLCVVVALAGNQILPAVFMNAVISLLWGGFHTRVGVKNRLEQIFQAEEEEPE